LKARDDGFPAKRYVFNNEVSCLLSFVVSRHQQLLFTWFTPTTPGRLAVVGIPPDVVVAHNNIITSLFHGHPTHRDSIQESYDWKTVLNIRDVAYINLQKVMLLLLLWKVST
jgi:hypothetical protein